MSFAFLGLKDPLVQALVENQFTEPTPIQRDSIPLTLAGKDLIGQAKTGSGKTAAYLLPILHQLSEFIYKTNKPMRCLILVPTRELAHQVNESIQNLGRFLVPRLKSTAVFGGVGVDGQINKLKQGMDILVATPGRLLDLDQQGLLKWNKLQFLVLDEMDRMLDMGFAKEIKEIIRRLPSKRQNLMFSATMNEAVESLGMMIAQNAEICKIQNSAEDFLDIEHRAHVLDPDEKMSALIHLLRHNRFDQVLIFANTKNVVDQISAQLKSQHIKSGVMHGDFTQQERSEAIRKMKEGKYIALVATDLASRGIDIPDLPCVIQYDLANTTDDYIHRTGRTGRAGLSGLVISLIVATQQNKIKSYANALGVDIPIENLAHFQKAKTTQNLPKGKVSTPPPRVPVRESARKEFKGGRPPIKKRGR